MMVQVVGQDKKATVNGLAESIGSISFPGFTHAYIRMTMRVFGANSSFIEAHLSARKSKWPEGRHISYLPEGTPHRPHILQRGAIVHV
ncbi:hypothetical protein DC20_21515 (plasmid) [Rufibacter tibetensis]|uniref:Uncharacterized protein n=1 Tax=Rufibacter tibetensis TaxID=512763 RepID=A0A0P0D3F6_9BACT|nr:hypothetical protein DC20_21515 [Rufibacter tibetensis]